VGNSQSGHWERVRRHIQSGEVDMKRRKRLLFKRGFCDEPFWRHFRICKESDRRGEGGGRKCETPLLECRCRVLKKKDPGYLKIRTGNQR